MRLDFSNLITLLIALSSILYTVNAIQCYQCDSNEDDTCPSSEKFNTKINALVDCSSFEANVPGTFCMKETQESPGWWGWKKVTRRCGSRSSVGVAWGCRWEFIDNGVFKETCYCQDRNGCNGSSTLYISLSLLILAVTTTVVQQLFH